MQRPVSVWPRGYWPRYWELLGEEWGGGTGPGQWIVSHRGITQQLNHQPITAARALCPPPLRRHSLNCYISAPLALPCSRLVPRSFGLGPGVQTRLSHLTYCTATQIRPRIMPEGRLRDMDGAKGTRIRP